MARYIDADRLINEFTGNGGVFVYGIDAIKAIVSRVNAQPIADVEEVKHGYWKHNLYCSVCDYLYDTGEYTNAKDFCPKCGAKMDGGNAE